MDREHNPFRQIGVLRQALEDAKRPIGFLLGAGASSAIKVKDGQSLIPDVVSMTTRLEEKMANSKHKACFGLLSSQLKSQKANANVEDYLTFVRNLLEVVDKTPLKDLDHEGLTSVDLEITEFVRTTTSVNLPDEITPFDQLAVWVRSASRGHPVEIFTLNYDLLVEQAFERRKVPFFDGFIGAHEPFFDTFAIESEVNRKGDSDRIPSRWARLWKVHGSINWWAKKVGDSIDVIRTREGAGRACLIFPSHLKYDQARQMPYLAMMERLKQFLALPSSVLITCGYSFRDRHINALLVQALSGRSDAVTFGMMRGGVEKYGDVIPIAESVPNLNLLARDGAVVGGKKGSWGLADNSPMLAYGLAKESKKVDGATKEVWVLTLGDFVEAGRMLHDLTGRAPIETAA